MFSTYQQIKVKQCFVSGYEHSYKHTLLNVFTSFHPIIEFLLLLDADVGETLPSLHNQKKEKMWSDDRSHQT